MLESGILNLGGEIYNFPHEHLSYTHLTMLNYTVLYNKRSYLKILNMDKYNNIHITYYENHAIFFKIENL